MIHTPVHASWLNQVEIVFSVIQKKVLTPNDFPGLGTLAVVPFVPGTAAPPRRSAGN